MQKYEKNYKWWLQYVIIPVLVGGGIISYFMPPILNSPWEVKSPNKFVIVLQDTKSKVNICYKEGDAEKIGIDNSNLIDPRVGNFRYIFKNSCGTFEIESGPNLGIFIIDKATYAKGTYEIK